MGINREYATTGGHAVFQYGDQLAAFDLVDHGKFRRIGNAQPCQCGAAGNLRAVDLYGTGNLNVDLLAILIFEQPGCCGFSDWYPLHMESC